MLLKKQSETIYDNNHEKRPKRIAINTLSLNNDRNIDESFFERKDANMLTMTIIAAIAKKTKQKNLKIIEISILTPS